jgi:hypothetical protein
VLVYHLGTFSVSFVDPWPPDHTITLDNPRARYARPGGSSGSAVHAAKGSGWQDCGSLSEPRALPECPG